jgi:hypothetical protein
MDLRFSRNGSVGLIGLVLLGGCAANTNAPVDDESGDVSAGEEALRAPVEDVAFAEFDDAAGIGKAGQREARIVITRAATYARVFGHAAPADVDFRAGDAVVFYSAGVKPTGGYEAAILSIQHSGAALGITTQLVSPGKECAVTDSLTTPHVLAKFKRPRPLTRVRFTREDEVRDCTQPSGPTCGGIAGIACPGSGKCSDNPNDSCDPQHGGADCGGICTCIETQLCVRGLVWNGSPDVCACVPAADGGQP